MKRKKSKNKIKKKSKSKAKKYYNKNILITATHWYCINKNENSCDQTSHLNSVYLYHRFLQIYDKNKILYLKSPKIHRSIEDANRKPQKILINFHNKINLLYHKGVKIVLDIHSYSMNKNLPFYLLYIDENYQKYYCNIIAKSICYQMNINFNPEMIKLGLNINQIINSALLYHKTKLAIIIEIYDGLDDFTRIQLLNAIADIIITINNNI
jgi:hypothetical protein